MSLYVQDGYVQPGYVQGSPESPPVDGEWSPGEKRNMHFFVSELQDLHEVYLSVSSQIGDDDVAMVMLPGMLSVAYVDKNRIKVLSNGNGSGAINVDMQIVAPDGSTITGGEINQISPDTFEVTLPEGFTGNDFSIRFTVNT